MCRPEHFAVAYSINPWMDPHSWSRNDRSLTAASAREWHALHRRLVELGAEIELVPAAPGIPDLVFTDPPYTPEGVALFLGRGAETLRDRVNGRLVMAYGFSPLAPALGVKVQRAVHELDLAVEAILPAFNRYEGAQAIGSGPWQLCKTTLRARCGLWVSPAT